MRRATSLAAAAAVLAAGALTAPGPLASASSEVRASQRAIELDLYARSKNTLRRLNVKADCFDDPCELRVSGAVVAGNDRFPIRPRTRSIRPGEIHKLGLRLKGAGAGGEVRELLADGAKPVAKIRGKATGEDGTTDTARVEVKIRTRSQLRR